MKFFRSLKFQILLIALLPILLIDTLLTIRHVDTSITRAERLLQNNGEIIARQIANAAEFNLFTGDFVRMQHLLDQTTNSNDIVYSAIYDEQGNTIAESIGSDYDPAQTTEYLYYRHPVSTQILESSDVFNPDYGEAEVSPRTLGWVHIYLSRERLRQEKVSVIQEGFVYFLASLALAIVLTLLVSRRVTQPIISLLGHIKKIESGELGEIIHSLEGNEIGRLQKGFNRMSQALAANRSQLDQKIKNATLELINAVTDLEYKNRELSRARDEAQQAIETKSQFLANMSHEIRTPINGIAGFANLLLRSGLNPNQQRYAQVIGQSTADLSDIVNEVLDFSKLESDKVEIISTPFNLHDLVESARDSMFTEAIDKNIDLFLTIYSDTPRRVVGDQLRVKQILVNLIGNAIKFTDRGFVDITVHIEDFDRDRVVIRFKVRDSGIGISKEDQKLLFKAFKQIDSETNRRFAGTGLGLVISKNLALLMGGDIEIDSVSDYGSLFSLVLPFLQIEEPPVEIDEGLPLTGMLIAAEPHALNEIQSLFDRAGFDSEGMLIEQDSHLDTLRQSIRQNQRYLDFIAIDLRHNPFTPQDLFNPELIKSKRIILMHYDLDRVGFDTSDYEFISLINTSRDLRHMMLHASSSLQPDNMSEHAPGTRHSVLIVDDNRVNLMLASELSRSWGHQPYEARNAQEALELFDSMTFDLILLDIQMPEVDGVQLMQIMRRRSPELATPIVAITANQHESERKRLLDAGFDAFCGKPLREGRLRALLDHKRIPLDDLEILSVQSTRDDDLSIDLDLTLKLSAQNRKISNELFVMLYDEIPEYVEQVENALESDSNEAMQQAIHKIQGVTRYAGLPVLKRLLDQFESAWAIDPARVTGLAAQINTELKHIRQQLPGLLEGVGGKQ